MYFCIKLGFKAFFLKKICLVVCSIISDTQGMIRKLFNNVFTHYAIQLYKRKINQETHTYCNSP